MSKNTDLIKKFNNNLLSNIKLSNYNWFNLGGPAEYFFKPESKAQLIDFLKENKKNKLKLTILGAGSNTLIRDNGIKGVVIKLGSNFSQINLIGKDVLEVGAATLDRKISTFAKNHGIGNLEFLSCIPGSIGGAIIMNSGCYGNDISKVLISLKAVDMNKCIEKEFKRDEIEFSYRGSNLNENLIITSVKLQGKSGNKEEIEKRQNELIEKKKITQPSQIKTCGSTFKNPKNKKAWELIKSSNCETASFGKASISKKHSNFFVNEGGASSEDIERLIKFVKQKVTEKHNIKLDLELKIIGEEKKND